MRGGPERGRSLYVEGPGEIAWRRGALEVRNRHGRARYFPLDRIARIVALGEVRWREGVLTSCAAAGVPVLALTEDGRASWTLVPGTGVSVDLAQALIAARESPRWEERYRAWFDSQDRRLRRHTCQALGWEDSGARAVWTRLERTLANAWGAERVEHLLTRLDSLARLEAADALAEREVPADLAGGWIGVSLVDDIGTLLGWPLRGKLVATAHRERTPPMETEEQMISLYETAAAGTVRGAARRLVAYLWKLRP